MEARKDNSWTHELSDYLWFSENVVFRKNKPEES